MTNSPAMVMGGMRRMAQLAVVCGAALMACVPAVNAVTLDVPYVPTPADVVKRMLEVAEVGPDDFVIDLGSGDGRIAIAAVKNHGAKGALGVDLNPERIAEARANAQEAGVTDKVEFQEQNLFETDFSHATVLTMYLLPDVNVALRPKILKLKPGTRVVSHAFDMEAWESDHYERVDGRSVYLWIVPAQVAGQWKLEGPEGNLELQLEQKYQQVSGTARDEQGASHPVTGSLHGSTLELTVGEGDAAMTLAGNVQGDSLLADRKSTDSAGKAGQSWKGSRQ